MKQYAKPFYQLILRNLMWTQKTEFNHIQEFPIQKQLDGDHEFDYNVSSYTEFDPLKFVVVGTIDGTSRIETASLEFVGTPINPDFDIFPDKIVDTAKEQSTNIAKEFIKRGVKVIRPGYVDHSIKFKITGPETVGYNSFNPRDLILTYHDCMIEFPSYLHCRARQLLSYQWIEKIAAKNGAKIYKAPKLEFDYFLLEKDPQAQKTDIVYADAANLSKLGLDIIFLISPSGSWGGYKKFREFMQKKFDGKVRIHPFADVYPSVHIDCTISIVGYNKKLDKNIAIVDGNYLSPSNMPAILRGKNWVILDVTKVTDEKTDFPERFLTSDKIGINTIALGPSVIMINKLQTKLIGILNSYGVQTIPMAHTYARQIGGGFHCMTNDMVREDTYGFKKTLETPKEQLSLQQRAGLFDPQLLEFLEKKGDILDWVKICNENKIYPTYLTEHLSPEELQAQNQRHQIGKGK